jgi:hypothetical protein
VLRSALTVWPCVRRSSVAHLVWPTVPNDAVAVLCCPHSVPDVELHLHRHHVPPASKDMIRERCSGQDGAHYEIHYARRHCMGLTWRSNKVSLYTSWPAGHAGCECTTEERQGVALAREDTMSVDVLALGMSQDKRTPHPRPTSSMSSPRWSSAQQ